jgi:hypothetical protein
VSGKQTIGLTLAAFLVLCALGFSVASCVSKRELEDQYRLEFEIQAERERLLDAGPPNPRPCAAEGAVPADYLPLGDDGQDPPATVLKLRELCAKDTNANGVIHVVRTGTYTIVNCWTGKADRNGFMGEDRNIWSRAVYEGP